MMERSDVRLYKILAEVRRRSIKKLEAELASCRNEHQRCLQRQADCRADRVACHDALDAYRTTTAARTQSGASVKLGDLVSARAHGTTLEEKLAAACSALLEADRAANDQEQECMAAASRLAAAEQRLENLQKNVSLLERRALAVQEDMQEEESAEQFAALVVRSRTVMAPGTHTTV